MNGIFPWLDKVIVQLVADKVPVENIVETVKTDVFTREDILNHFNTYMDKIKQREGSWDIKMSDFISSHYRQEKMFYDPGHPTEIIINYIAAEVLSFLKINVEDVAITSTPMDTHEIPVYSCVYNALELEWDNSYIRKKGKKCKDIMDMEEYIREYIFWCYPDCT